MLKRTLIVLCFMITACTNQVTGAPQQAAQTHPNQEAYPNPDAETYAKNYGISLDDALRQFHLQDVAGELQATLREKEADTFAAIWLEHTPEFKIVVLFTHDAEQKIKPYLTDELVGVVEARDVEASRAMLEDVDGEIKSILLNLGIQVESELNVYENRITIFVNEADRNQFDSAVKDKLIVIPNNVEIITVWKLGQTGEAANPPSLGDHFPQLATPPSVYLDTPLIEGELVLENGCLRVSGVKNLLRGNSLLLVWDSRFSTQTEKGVVQVVDSSTGEVLVSVGDYVAIGDGGDNIKPTNKPIPDECPGPYWIVGEFIKKIDKP